MKRRGAPKREKLVYTTVLLPPDVVEWLEQLAKVRGRSRSSVVRAILTGVKDKGGLVE